MNQGAWLVVIDMQAVFAEPDSPWFLPGYPAVADAVAALLPAFGERVAFTRFIPPAQVAGSWRGYYVKWPFAAASPPGSKLWAVTPPFQPRHTVDTHQFSKWTPGLRALVGDPATIVLCGVSTDCCVLATALAAIEDGAQVRVVADACGAKSAGLHAAPLALMAGRAPQITLTDVATEACCIGTRTDDR